MTKIKTPLGYIDLEFIEKLSSEIETLDELARFYKKRIVEKPQTYKSLLEDFEIQFTYNSNAIEGNTLTLSETKVVLEGVTIGGKSIREHLEVTDHKNATDYMLSLALSGNEYPFTEENIRELHRIVLDKSAPHIAGVYRGDNVYITGARFKPPHYGVVPLLMCEFIDSLKEWDFHPAILASLIHGEFVGIHPFENGNGRTSRLLMNLEFLREGYPPVIIQNKNRAQYYDALDAAHVEFDYYPFAKLVIDEAIVNATQYAKILED